MSGYKMHIAQRGKNAGQWVRCTAKGTCRVGGNHISSETLKTLHALEKAAGKTPQKGDLNYDEYVKWKENQANNPTYLASNKQPIPPIKTETKTDLKQAAFEAIQNQQAKTEEENQNSLNKLFIQPATTADEKDANYVIENNLDGKTNVLLAISLTQSQWMSFLDKSYRLGIDIPLDFVKKGGANFRAGNTLFETILPLRGTAEKLQDLSKEAGV